MPESLWQAVQEETEKQKADLQPQTGSSQAKKGAGLPSPTRIGDRDEKRTRKPTEPTTVRTSVPTSGRPKERRAERRPYDFFHDQVLWLKETKLEIEKRHGKTIPANAMVQLAVDLLIEDYEKNKERSKLVCTLVSAGPPCQRPAGRSSGRPA